MVSAELCLTINKDSKNVRCCYCYPYSPGNYKTLKIGRMKLFGSWHRYLGNDHSSPSRCGWNILPYFTEIGFGQWNFRVHDASNGFRCSFLDWHGL